MIEKIYLCGITATPPNRKITKTALGSTETVEWEHCDNIIELVNKLKSNGIKVWSVEQTENSTTLKEIKQLENFDKHALIFGNEIKDNQTAGIIITNYGVTEKPIDDEKYDLFPEGLFIYDNTFVGGGENPKGGSSEISQTIIGILKMILSINIFRFLRVLI